MKQQSGDISPPFKSGKSRAVNLQEIPEKKGGLFYAIFVLQSEGKLFIMKEGKLIQGKIIRIYDNNNNGFLIENKKTIHNVTAEIEYTINNDRKTITVDHLAINVNRLDNYTSKQVKIYVYNNMSYIDIIN